MHTHTHTQSWQFSANSIHYLLGFWQKLVGSVPYIRITEPHLLDTYIPEVPSKHYSISGTLVHTITHAWDQAFNWDRDGLYSAQYRSCALLNAAHLYAVRHRFNSRRRYSLLSAAVFIQPFSIKAIIRIEAHFLFEECHRRISLIGAYFLPVEL